MNFIRVDARDGLAVLGNRTLQSPIKNGQVEIGLRGEDVAISESAANAVPLSVRVVEPMGSHLLVTGTILGQPARIVAPSSATILSGTEIHLEFDPARLTWIDSASGKAIGR